MAYDAEDMRMWRVETGRTSSLTVPIEVLAKLLKQPDARLVLSQHFGPFLCRAIEHSPKARAAA